MNTLAGLDEPARSRGRPTDYDPILVGIAQRMCENGATDDELAQAFGVCNFTIRRWAAAHPDFCAALKVGKGAPDDRVERSLYQRAVGYTHRAVKIMQFQGGVIKEEFDEHIPPDPGAAKLWLTNRRRKEWSEKVALEHSGPDGGPIQTITTEMTPQEAAALYAKSLNAER